MSSLKVHFRVFIRLMKINILKNLTYRANLLLLFLDSLLWFTLSVVFFNIIYLHVDNINGWSKYQMYLLIGVADLIKSILFTFFIRGLTRLPNLIRNGDLDGILTKPLNSQFLISVNDFNLSAALNLLPSIFLIIFSSTKLNIHLISSHGVLFLFMILTSSIFCYSLWFIIMTLSMWMKNSGNLNEFFLSLQTMMRYPSGIYKGATGVLLLVIVPIVVSSNLPVTILIGQFSFKKVFLFIVVALAYLIMSQIFWRFSLRFYDSASS
ncbi:multidrug transporter permease [Brevibacillus laterosporus]|uniref:ABC transporter permease n=1 Tax=Brevibacillus laterosporus TaxID=1465 RepID=UPI000C769BFB|nr:ABC-2 family transporter protein [Brevibacillus laterosporus]AUM64507.1 multidrug transporter permease [Brevibacillus laterosporus]